MSDDYDVLEVIQPWKITLFRRKGQPTIYYYFTIHKKPIKRSTFTSHLEQAKEFAIQKYFSMKSGEPPRQTIRFDKVAEKFMQWKRAFVSDKTYSEYIRQVKFLIERFKDKDIETFTINDYNEYDQWRRSYYTLHKRKRTQTYTRNDKKLKGCTFKDCGNTTINREVGLLVSILICSQTILGLNQSRKIPPWKKLPERIRTELLSKEEYDKLRDYWLNKNPYYWDIISFVASTGVRYPSEVAKLKWKDVNFERNFLIIRERKGKPNKDMSIPLLGTGRDILLRLKERPNISTQGEDYVFVDAKGKRVVNIRISFRRSLRECGIDATLITMYSLRHLYATRIILNQPDIPHKILAKAMGHTDTKMLDKVYGHLDTEGMVKIFKESEDKRGDEEGEARLKRVYESWFPKK